MTNPNLTEIVCIFDKSGSMAPLAEDSRGGFNSFVEEQKKVAGSARLTLTLFDTATRVVHESLALEDVPVMESFPVGGGTAMYDAIGQTIDLVGARLAAESEADRPSRVMVVVMTDGEENSSTMYTQKDVSARVKHQEEKYNWSFIFLGASIDAEAVGEGIGMRTSNAMNYRPTSGGVRDVMKHMIGTVSAGRYASPGAYLAEVTLCCESAKDAQGFVKDLDAALADAVTSSSTGSPV